MSAPVLSDDAIYFLAALSDAGGKNVSRKHLPLADRKQDKVRQKLRREGYVHYSTGWSLTNRGRHALDDAVAAEARKP